MTDGRDEATADEATADDAPGGRRVVRTVAAWVATALAGLLVFGALVMPNEISDLTPGAFLRIPVEGLLGVALVLVLPAKARLVAAALGGVVLGLLAIVKILDMGFLEVLDRPFDLVLDWILLQYVVEFLTQSFGRTGAIGAAVAAAVLAAAVLVLVPLAVLRLTRLVVRHRTAATRGVTALAALCLLLGARAIPDVPVAGLAYDRALQVHAGLQDRNEFAALASVDAFRDTPGEELLTGLRGKDVMVTFVESYGRDAVEDPEYAAQVGAVLDAGNRRLGAAGYASRSGFLTSPIAGGGSWLAQATLLSGLWIDNEQRYRTLVSSDRLTLNGAFRRANWRTVGIMPGITRAWPEGAFYDFDQVYDLPNLGYRGPGFGFATMPDQYALSAFEHFEHAKPDRAPVMAEIPLLSSHSPWTRIPDLIDWDDVGDGSVFHDMVKASSPDVVGRDTTRIRADYRRSIEYSLNTLISYVETYGDDDLVLVFLGDHQASPLITGDSPNRDVPITIVARDPAVLDRITGWGWQDGLKPSPQAPVWPMDAFRDRFLTAFGPQPPSAQSPAPR